MKKASLFLFLLVLAACSSKPDSGASAQEKQQVNPLDSILGDKLIDKQTNKIRPNNFSELLTITRSDLDRKSELYLVKNIDNNFKILKQKKSYLEARNFNVLFKLETEKISKYIVINDFQIEGAFRNGTELFILTGDLENHNKYWKSDNRIRLIKFDTQLNQLWEYTAETHQFPLRAVGIKKEDNHIVATVEVIKGCSVCTNNLELTFNQKGNCISAAEKSRTHSATELDSAFISETFIR